MNDRYKRQMLLDEIGTEGQKKLSQARVLVVGAGGLGSPALTYLVCAGVGFIRIVDNDSVTESNLNRQFLYGISDVGKNKAELAKNRLSAQNDAIDIEAIGERLTQGNAAALLDGIDVVVDCVDNIATRLLLNRLCLNKGIPLIEGGVEGFYGFVTVIDQDTACLECMGFYEGESRGPAPVIGVTAGIIGCMEAEECIRLLLGMGSDLYGKCLQYDGINQTMTKVAIKKNPNCSCITEMTG